MSDYVWDDQTEQWIDSGTTYQDTWFFPDNGSSNVSDYFVTDTGLIQSIGGDYGTFKDGAWVPYTGGDVATFLSGSITPSGVARTDMQRLGSYLRNMLTGQGSMADYGTALAGLMGLYERMNRPDPAWQGKVTKTPYAAPATTQAFTEAVQKRPYGERVMGMDPFTYSGGVPAASPAPTKSIFASKPVETAATQTAPVTTKPVTTAAPAAASEVSKLLPIPNAATAAQGGLMGLARGGRAAPPRYLRGQTDGMADKIPSNIDGVQPAKLSHGEFVIPADVVSHLGNGNSDAGAKVLYKMMDRVRHARTGSKKQGKQINPEKFTPGGIAGYAGGGAVAFQTGGVTGSTPTGSTTATGLSPYIGDYIAGADGYLSKAWGLSEKPYEAYKGPLTAGTAPLQSQAFQDLGNLQVPGAMGQATTTAGNIATKLGGMSYSPVGEMFSAQQAMNYMNPYLQAALDPQLKELTRQSDIARMSDAARLAQAGAFGGSRQAIMESEGRRNLLGKQADVLGQGYATAYDKAMAQFNADQARKIGEAQYGSEYGLKALGQQLGAAQAQSALGQAEFGTGLQGLNAQMNAGQIQRDIEKENVAAQLAQWQESQKYPFEQLKFAQSMIQGLPVGAQTSSANTSLFSDLAGGIAELMRLRGLLGGSPAPAPAPAPAPGTPG